MDLNSLPDARHAFRMIIGACGGARTLSEAREALWTYAAAHAAMKEAVKVPSVETVVGEVILALSSDLIERWGFERLWGTSEI